MPKLLLDIDDALYPRLRSAMTARYMAAFHLAELLRLKLKKSDRADVEVHAAPAAGLGAV